MIPAAPMDIVPRGTIWRRMSPDMGANPLWREQRPAIMVSFRARLWQAERGIWLNERLPQRAKIHPGPIVPRGTIWQLRAVRDRKGYLALVFH